MAHMALGSLISLKDDHEVYSSATVGDARLPLNPER